MKQYKYWTDGYDSGLTPIPPNSKDNKKVVFIKDLLKEIKQWNLWYDYSGNAETFRKELIKKLRKG